VAFSAGKALVFKLDNAAGSLQTLTAYVKSCDFPVQDIDTLDTTVFGLSSRTYIVGLKSGKFTISGPQDPTMDAHLSGILSGLSAGGSCSFEIHPAGTASGAPKYTGECFLTSYKPAAQVDGLWEYSAEFTVTGDVTRGTN
jgi:hypothetical protein